MVRVLDRIAANRGYPAMLRMDNGPGFISLVLAEWAEKHAVKLEFIQPGKPTQNAFIERFNRTYRTEILDFYLFRTLNEVREITEKWLSEYNCERPHESLNNMTPEEYRQHHYLAGISKNEWHDYVGHLHNQLVKIYNLDTQLRFYFIIKALIRHNNVHQQEIPRF